ncbi:hypothetical protein [Anaeroselena agilis]|uniref:Uncharacterized protein n=1 Tax=Anaeroselena agilis TaxID=3063788 RepID=A0ABU3NYH1_9FIRM|nr:hypothetical protein [Selenomonadales bacterium 4137-cl]
MILRYNDYYRLTEGYLRNLVSFQTALENMSATREQKLAELESSRMPIAKYGTEPGGGSELTQPESYADRLMFLQREIRELDMEIMELQTLVNKIESALGTLNGTCRKLIELRYMGNRQWKEIEDVIGYSERHSRRQTGKAVWLICDALFRYRLREDRNFQFVS